MVYGEVSFPGEKYSSFFSEKLIKIGLHIMTLLWKEELWEKQF